MQIATPFTLGGSKPGSKWTNPEKTPDSTKLASTPLASVARAMSRPSPAEFGLKKQTKIVEADKGKKVNRQSMPAQFASMQLKKATEWVQHELPSSVEEPFTMASKAALADQRITEASYGKIRLNAAGQAIVLQQGGHIEKDNKGMIEPTPAFRFSPALRKVSVSEPTPHKDAEDKSTLVELKVEKSNLPTTTAQEVHIAAPRRTSYADISLKTVPQSPTKSPQVRKASFVGISLKESGHGHIVKSGGDLKSKTEVKAFELPEEFGKVQLKKSATPLKPEVEVLEEQVPEFEKVQLKTSTTPVKPEIELPEETKLDYTSVHLKDASIPVKEEVEVLEEQLPEYTSVQLKTTEPVERPKIQERRASYTEIKLNQSEHGEVIKTGGDVLVPKNKTVQEPAYLTAPLRPAPPTPNKGVQPLKASFAEKKLKQSSHGEAVKRGEDPAAKPIQGFELPDEFGKVQLKKASTPVKPEIDILEEEKLDYSSVHLKDASTPVKAEVEILEEKAPEFGTVQLKKATTPIKPEIELPIEEVLDYTSVHLKDASTPINAEVEVLEEQAPEYTSVQLKTTEPVERPKVQEHRASYAEIKLNQSEHGEVIKSGGDVLAPRSTSRLAQPSYSAVQLKESGHGNVIKSGGDVVKGPNQKQEPSYSAVQLKESAHGSVIKTGGDVKKQADNANRHALPEEFAAVKLKEPDDLLPPEVEILEEVKPDYNINLRKSTHGAAIQNGGDVKREEDSRSHPLPKEFDAVELKKPDPQMKPEVEVVPEIVPDYKSVPLRPAEPVKKSIQPSRRASYSDLELRKSEHGAAIKNGGDVVKIHDGHQKEAAFAVIELKSTGHGNMLRSGGTGIDLTEKFDGPQNHASPYTQLKAADTTGKSKSNSPPGEKPDHFVMPLNTAKPMKKHEARPRRATYSFVHLQKIGPGASITAKDDAAGQMKRVAKPSEEKKEEVTESKDMAENAIMKARRASYAGIQLKSTGRPVLQ